MQECLWMIGTKYLIRINFHRCIFTCFNYFARIYVRALGIKVYYIFYANMGCLRNVQFEICLRTNLFS